MTQKSVQLIRRLDDQFVEASLYTGMKPEDILLVEREWGPIRAQIMQELLGATIERSRWPESLHWNWTLKSSQVRLLVATGFGIVSDNRWQGVMLTKTAPYVSRLVARSNKPIVYIDYLETAPWNWNIKEINQAGLLKGVGTSLFLAAVRQSFDEGFGGRVGLHALPQAKRFYAETLGMTDLGADITKQNLHYFELTEILATQILRGGANDDS